MIPSIQTHKNQIKNHKKSKEHKLDQIQDSKYLRNWMLQSVRRNTTNKIPHCFENMQLNFSIRTLPLPLFVIINPKEETTMKNKIKKHTNKEKKKGEIDSEITWCREQGLALPAFEDDLIAPTRMRHWSMGLRTRAPNGLAFLNDLDGPKPLLK